MKNLKYLIILMLCPVLWVSAQQLAVQMNLNNSLPSSEVDYDGFQELTDDVYEYRKTRLVNFDAFLKKSKEKGVLILDTRSKERYDQKHIKGAVHLNFSDFTAQKLAKIIPTFDTPILIYCNNNIANDPIHFAMKSAPLALNIPTFINLYGYGYKNIYELENLIPIEHERIVFEGTTMKQSK